jgi:hypothetical protein
VFGLLLAPCLSEAYLSISPDGTLSCCGRFFASMSEASGAEVTLGAWVLQLWPSSLVAQLPSLKDLVKEALQYQGLDQDVSAEQK